MASATPAQDQITKEELEKIERQVKRDLEDEQERMIEESRISSAVSRIIAGSRKYLKAKAENPASGADDFTLNVVSDFYLSYVPLVEDRQMPTMATDYKSIMYSPRFLLRLMDEAACRNIMDGSKHGDLQVKENIVRAVTEIAGITLTEDQQAAFWKAASGMAEKIWKKDSSEAAEKTRRDAWTAGLAAAGIDESAFSYDDVIRPAVVKIDEIYIGKHKSDINERFIKGVGAVLLHEVLHIIRGDVAENDKKRQEFVWLSSPSGSSQMDDGAGIELRQILNRAMDAVINDTIERELLGERVLPEWCIRKTGASEQETRSIYMETVREAAVSMAEALGKEYIPSEGVIPLEHDFRKLFFESLEKQQEVMKQIKSQQQQQAQQGQGQQQQGSGQQGQGQQQQGSGEGQQNTPGQDQSSGQKGKGKGKGAGKGAPGQDQQSSPGSGGSGGQEQPSESDGSQGESGGQPQDWSEWHKINPQKHVHNAIAKVFGGEPAPDLTTEPPVEEEGQGQGQKGQGQGKGQGNSGGKGPQDWTDYPGKPLDDHDRSSDEIKKEQDKNGTDESRKDVEDILKKVVREHMEKSGTRSRGQGSSLADILIALAEEDVPPPPSFMERLQTRLDSIRSVIPKKTHKKLARGIYGIAPQFAAFGKGALPPALKFPKNRGHILIAIDVSGSMGNEDVKKAVLETLSILSKMEEGHLVSIVQIDDGIVDWRQFYTGTGEIEAYKDEIFSDGGYRRHGAGGTGYEHLFNVVLPAVEAGVPVQYSEGVPEEFPGKDYGVPLMMIPPKKIVFYTDWGFSDANLRPPMLVDDMLWVGVTDRPNFAQPRFGEVFECDATAEQTISGEPGM